MKKDLIKPNFFIINVAGHQKLRKSSVHKKARQKEFLPGFFRAWNAYPVARKLGIGPCPDF